LGSPERREKYGAEHVARVGVYSHLRAVSSLKAAMRLDGLTDDQVRTVRQPAGGRGGEARAIDAPGVAAGHGGLTVGPLLAFTFALTRIATCRTPCEKPSTSAGPPADLP